MRNKPDGSHRMILNLSKFNKLIPKQSFQMETLEKALKLIKPGSFFCKLDLKDAFYSIPIHNESKKYFRFKFDSQLFQFEVMPQGYRESPRIFTKVLKVPLAFLRAKGHIISAYLDDMLLIGFSYEDCLHNCKDSIELFTRLGFTINIPKSKFTPCTSIEFLGFIIDSITMTVKPSKKKCDSIIYAIKNLLKTHEFSIRTFSEIIGKLVALKPGNKYTLLHVKNLEILRNRFLRISKGNYDSMMFLNDVCLSDLNWWIGNMDAFPKPIRLSKVSVNIETDASSEIGWGAHLITKNNPRVKAGGPWSAEEKHLHINILELLAVKMSLNSVGRYLKYEHILIKTDNSTVVACINKQGSSKKKLNRLTRQIWDKMISKHNYISATYIPGKLNVVSDKESRNKIYKETEWTLHQDSFNYVNDKLGPFDLDLFASRLNNKMHPYVSWKSDPGSYFCNAFLLDWDTIFPYCFPPFNLIIRVLQKVMQDKAKICIIVPRWTTQQFWPVLQKLLVKPYVTIPWRKDLLTNPVLKSKLHPLIVKKKMTLLACLISGENM